MARTRSISYAVDSSQTSKVDRLLAADDPDDLVKELVSARLLKLKEDTRKIQIENAITLREYVSIAEVGSEIDAAFTRVRNKLLALENKLLILAPIDDPVEVRKIVRQEIDEILVELSYQDEINKEIEILNDAITSTTEGSGETLS
jgi:hypothetical protein